MIKDMFHMIIVFLLTISFMTIIGCVDTYDETDEIANQRFEKFTSQEKTIYKAVQDVWGQRPLKYVREAAGRRETRPAENILPFKDIANVIKSNNSASLKLDAGWQASTKNKYIKARWDRVDEKWYRELMLTMGVTEIVKQDLIPESVEEVISDTPEVEKEYIPAVVEEYNDNQDETIKINLEGIIPESKYDDLYYEIRHCDEAVFTYKQIIDDRILTWDDYELLIRISIKCKAVNILNKMETSK